MSETTYAKGLEGVIAAESTICRVDGVNGDLFYRGVSIWDLAEHSSFEEVTYLLLYEELPTAEQLAEFTQRMRSQRGLPPAVIEMIREFPDNGSPMELLQSVISYLSGSVKHRIEHSANCNCRDTLHQIAQIATVLATYQRFKEGKPYVEPRSDLSHGANFLYMLRGEEPDPFEGQVMDTCLVLHAEHGFCASTFTARVVASTLSTCYCSISAAIGALYGSLHGGANERALAMAQQIGSKEYEQIMFRWKDDWPGFLRAILLGLLEEIIWRQAPAVFDEFGLQLDQFLHLLNEPRFNGCKRVEFLDIGPLTQRLIHQELPFAGGSCQQGEQLLQGFLVEVLGKP